jgi:3-hydroxyisobutyrate dehydrogenase-like beta-hydroxyacid dehydrogenase
MAQANGGNAVGIAIIGAGIMRSVMTRNLVAAELDSRMWDRPSAVTAPLAEAGVLTTARLALASPS